MSDVTAAKPVPALPFIHVDERGRGSLQGVKCLSCGAVLVGAPRACSSCGERVALKPIELSETGRVHTYTIVHRSFPGVATPFVACVVDLDGGGAIRGTLRGVDAEPEALSAGLRVQVRFDTVEQASAPGLCFVSYYFLPEGDAHE